MYRAIIIGMLVLVGVLEAVPAPESPAYTLVPRSTVYEPLVVVDTTHAPSVPETAPEGPMVATTVAVPVALVRPDSPCQEWVPLAVASGWPRDRAVIERLADIVWRESRCNPEAWNETDPNGGSMGLMQINRFWCQPSKYWPSGYLQAHGVLESCDELLDPATNLHAGWVIYSYSYQRNGGDGWNPWKV
jgi:hypothetical protein